MARVSPALLAFNRGEISKIALARVDLAKLQLSAECQLNWMPYVVGPMMLRPGLIYVGEVLNDNPAKLLRFVYSKTDTALIELTANEMRVWIQEALLTRVSVGTTVSDPNFAGGGTWSTAGTTSGCTATITGGVATLTAAAVGGLSQIKQTLSIAGGDQNKEHALRIVVTDGPVTIRVGSAAGLQDYMTSTAIDQGTHSLVFTPTGASAFLQIESTDTWAKTLTSCNIEAAGVVTLPTNWGASDLANVRYDQSLDTLYVACSGQQQQKIERRGTRPNARGWSVVTYKSNDGPFNPLPSVPNTILTPSVYYGNGTLTSSNPLFQSGHVGGLFRLFCHGQANKCVLGAQGAFTDPIRVSGYNQSREFYITVSGTWSGTLTVQTSLVGPASQFQMIHGDGGTNASATITSNGNYITKDWALDSGLNGVTAWYRVGFLNAGDYTSGAPTVLFSNSSGIPFVDATAAAVSGGGQYAVVRVTGYTSPTQVNVELITSPESLALGMATPVPTLVGTPDWVEGQWSGVAGWPTSVCIHEGRLCWFGGAQAWLSASDAYANFADINFDGTSTGDGGAINVTLGSGPGDNIPWGLSLTRLIVAREQSIMSARSSNFDQPLTPSLFVIRECSDQGANRLPPVKIGKRGVYVQQSNRKVYELAFNAQEMDYDDRDLTRLNLDIGLPGFVDLDKATQPDHTIWLPRSDGQVACLLYDTKDEVEAWWRLQTLGVVENVAVLPSSATEDTTYFVVKRTINGVTKRFIEKLALRTECEGGSLNKQLDCATVYSGSAVSTVQAAQLPSTTVGVWADGAYLGTATADGSGNVTMPDGLTHSKIVVGLAGQIVQGSTEQFLQSRSPPDQVFAAAQSTLTVPSAYNGIPCEVFADQQPSGRMVHIGTLTPSGGVITLPNGITSAAITACFGYVAPFMSAKLGYGAQGGSPLTQKKKIDHVGLALFDAHPTSLQYGQRMNALEAMPAIEEHAAVSSTAIWSEFDEPMVELPGEWDTDARLCLMAQAPLPVKVGAAVVAVKTNEK